MKCLFVLKSLAKGDGVAHAIIPHIQTFEKDGHQTDFLLINVDANYDWEANGLHKHSVFQLRTSKFKISRKTIKSISETLQNGYDVVHVNITGIYALEVLAAAKFYGIKKRLYHVHSSGVSGTLSIAHKLFVKFIATLIKLMCTHKLACSNEAGKSFYGNLPFTVIKNKICASKFKFDINARNEIRKELEITDETLVIGTVARMSPEKRPLFCIDIIRELASKRKNIRYIWAGDGPMLAEMKARITQNGLDDIIKLVGTKTDINRWYSAFDVLILASEREGLPFACIEAQCSGVSVFASDGVPEETILTPYMIRIPVCMDAKYWAEQINMPKMSIDRSIGITYVEAAGYSADNGNAQLLDFYKHL